MRGKKKSGKNSSSKKPSEVNNKKKEETSDQEIVEKTENVDNSKERSENGDASSKRTTKKINDETENVDNLKDKTEDGAAGPSKKGSKKTVVPETDTSANSVRGKNKKSTNSSDEPLPTKKLRVRKEPVKTEVEPTKAKSREYEVDAILDQRKNKSVEEFLIKWKGYSEKENSWVPKSHLNCKRLLDDFLKSKK